MMAFALFPQLTRHINKFKVPRRGAHDSFAALNIMKDEAAAPVEKVMCFAAGVILLSWVFFVTVRRFSVHGTFANVLWCSSFCTSSVGVDSFVA